MQAKHHERASQIRIERQKNFVELVERAVRDGFSETQREAFESLNDGRAEFPSYSAFKVFKHRYCNQNGTIEEKKDGISSEIDGIFDELVTEPRGNNRGPERSFGHHTSKVKYAKRTEFEAETDKLEREGAHEVILDAIRDPKTGKVIDETFLRRIVAEWDRAAERIQRAVK